MSGTKVTLRKKFRGAMLGALLGDCMGAPYEGKTISAGDKLIIQRYFDKLEDPTFKCPFKKYTDDTAMTKAMARFLTDKPEPDYKFLSRLFVTEFFNEPKRGYGQGVVEVFAKLRHTKFADVFKPASEQFGGSGSFGNGGAMRIAPVPLFYHDNYEKMLEVAVNSTKITHTNRLGVNGAVLQCLAIQQALISSPRKKLNPREFCIELLYKIGQIELGEQNDEFDSSPEPQEYAEKIKMIGTLLSKPYDDDLDDEVINCLGNDVTAHESVPTAIYCFLKAMEEIPHIKTDNVFRRAIQYAISLGGDTDTIASMTGAIMGAYLGEDSINPILMKHCEKFNDIKEIADNLYEAQKSESDSEDELN